MNARTESSCHPEIFWTNVGLIGDALGLMSPDLADLLALPYRRFLSLRSLRQLPYAVNLECMARALHVSMDHLLKGQIDLQAIAAHRSNQLSHVPERYSEAAFSRGYWAAPMIGYLETKRGAPSAQRILRHCQIHPEVFRDSGARFNFRLQMDILDHAAEQGVTSQEFFEMGRFAIHMNHGSVLHGIIKDLATPECVYETAIGDFGSLFDENWDYSLQKISGGVARVVATPRREVMDALKVRSMSSRRVCDFKSGIGAALLEYRGWPTARVEKTHCVHEGDPACVFEFNFEQAKWRHRQPVTPLLSS